jgi:hypothetical protein
VAEQLVGAVDQVDVHVMAILIVHN